MQMKLVRDYFNSEVTLGTLFINGKYFCQTLEDTNREVAGESVENWKIKSKTCIGEGKYSVILSQSNRFKKRLPEILDVAGFSGIRIHSGNTSNDTEGCILVGVRRDGHSLSLSRLAMTELMAVLNSAHNIKLEIKNATIGKID